jgi:Sulfotransferase family
MQSAATIDRFRAPIVIRALNKFGGIFNGKVSRRLTPDELIETAQRRSGLDDFGPGDFREPLDRLLESCWRDAHLNVIGNIALRSDIIRILRNRLLLQRDRHLYPEIAQHEIRSPLFVLGLPRTGTTFLHTLLSADPENRAPLTWEVMEPSPPTEAEKQRRIRRTSQNLACLEWMAPNFRQLHPVGARLPQECVSLMSPSFLSDQFDTMYNVPRYREWFLQQDLQPAYSFHRRFLQHLHERKNGRRWVLKAPTHMFALPTLLSTYPDALFIQTHRAPVEAITSVSSLITILRRVFSDAVDPIRIGAEALQYWSIALRKFLLQRDRLPPERLLDISYAQLRRDPIGTVRSVYEYFGWPFTSAAENRMRHILAEQPRDLHGFHRYKPAQFGLRLEHELEFFSEYCERFSVSAAASSRSMQPQTVS